jgi:hypothetical protein
MNRGWLVACWVVASGCAHRFECAAHGGSTVRSLETEHFFVVSDLPLETTRVETRKLEQLWDAWVVFFGHAPTRGVPLRVVLSEPGAAREFVAEAAGFVRTSVPPMLFSTVIVTTGADGKDQSYSTNAHEMVHLVSHFWLPRQPRWISEGLAEYLGDATFVRDGVIRMGRWHWDGGSVDSLDDLWAWDEMREALGREEDLYQSAWAWIHYFSNRDEARLNQLWAALKTMPSSRAAFESIFPRAEWPALKVKVQAYLDERRFRGWETQVLREPALSEPKVLEPAAVHLVRRQFVETDAQRRVETRAALAVATTQSPELVLARFEDEVHGPELRTVIEVLPDDPRAMWLAASSPDLAPRERIHLLERARDLRPDDVRVLADFAFAALRRKDPRALEAAERAVALAPWWTPPHFQRARALANAGRCVEADEELVQIQGLANESTPRLLSQIAEARAKLARDCEARP